MDEREREREGGREGGREGAELEETEETAASKSYYLALEVPLRLRELLRIFCAVRGLSL